MVFRCGAIDEHEAKRQKNVYLKLPKPSASDLLFPSLLPLVADGHLVTSTRCDGVPEPPKC